VGRQAEIVISTDSGWLFPARPDLLSHVKSFFSLAFVVLVFLTVVCGAALLWYLSATSEFTRKAPHPAAEPATPPRASPTSKLP